MPYRCQAFCTRWLSSSSSYLLLQHLLKGKHTEVLRCPVTCPSHYQPSQTAARGLAQVVCTISQECLSSVSTRSGGGICTRCGSADSYTHTRELEFRGEPAMRLLFGTEPGWLTMFRAVRTLACNVLSKWYPAGCWGCTRASEFPPVKWLSSWSCGRLQALPVLWAPSGAGSDCWDQPCLADLEPGKKGRSRRGSDSTEFSVVKRQGTPESSRDRRGWRSRRVTPTSLSIPELGQRLHQIWFMNFFLICNIYSQCVGL